MLVIIYVSRELKSIIDKIHEICCRVNATKGDILLLLRLLYDEHMGRYKLIEKTGLSEATIRSLLSHLRRLGYIEKVNRAHSLSKTGKALIEEYLRLVKDEGYMKTPFNIGRYTYFIHASGLSSNVRTGIEQRDKAIIVGGKGAITLIYRNKQLLFPDSREKVSEYYPEFVKSVLLSFNLSDGDVLLFVGADDKARVRSIAYDVLLTIL